MQLTNFGKFGDKLGKEGGTTTPLHPVSAMELGAGTILPGSPAVLGVSWTNSKSGMLEGSDNLVTTTPTLVQVHSMVDSLVP